MKNIFLSQTCTIMRIFLLLFSALIIAACNGSHTAPDKPVVANNDSISLFNYSHLVRNQLKGKIKMIKNEDYYLSSNPENALMGKFPYKISVGYYDTVGFLTKINITLYSGQSVATLSKTFNFTTQKNDSLVEMAFNTETNKQTDKYVYIQKGPLSLLWRTYTYGDNHKQSFSEKLIKLDNKYRITEIQETGSDTVINNDYYSDSFFIQKKNKGSKVLSTDTSFLNIVVERDKEGNPTVYKLPEYGNTKDTVLTHVTYEYHQ
jgi:hypothetical protein